MQRNIALLPVKELKHPEMMWMESDEYRKDVLIADSLHLNFNNFEKPSTQDKMQTNCCVLVVCTWSLVTQSEKEMASVYFIVGGTFYQCFSVLVGQIMH